MKEGEDAETWSGKLIQIEQPVQSLGSLATCPHVVAPARFLGTLQVKPTLHAWLELALLSAAPQQSKKPLPSSTPVRIPTLKWRQGQGQNGVISLLQPSHYAERELGDDGGGGFLSVWR